MMFVSWPVVKNAHCDYFLSLISKKLDDLLHETETNKHENMSLIMYLYRSGSH